MTIEYDPMSSFSQGCPYSPDERFCEVFYAFGLRFASLCRYWRHLDETQCTYFEVVRNYVASVQSQGDHDVFAHMVLRDDLRADLAEFIEFSHGSVLAHGLAMIEELLSNIESDLRAEFGKPRSYKKSAKSTLDKGLELLRSGFGMDIRIEAKVAERLLAIRTVRNRLIHKMDKDLKPIEKDAIAAIGVDSEAGIDADFVENALETMATVVSSVESAYWALIDLRNTGSCEE